MSLPFTLPCSRAEVLLKLRPNGIIDESYLQFQESVVLSLVNIADLMCMVEWMLICGFSTSLTIPYQQNPFFVLS